MKSINHVNSTIDDDKVNFIIKWRWSPEIFFRRSSTLKVWFGAEEPFTFNKYLIGKVRLRYTKSDTRSTMVLGSLAWGCFNKVCYYSISWLFFICFFCSSSTTNIVQHMHTWRYKIYLITVSFGVIIIIWWLLLFWSVAGGVPSSEHPDMCVLWSAFCVIVRHNLEYILRLIIHSILDWETLWPKHLLGNCLSFIARIHF